MQGHMDIVYLRPDELIPYPANIKVHPPAQVDHIANSIKQFGWKQPIVVDKDKTVIIGHGRLLAAKQLLLESVPVVFADDLDEDQVRALRLADNKTNESPYDLGNLAEELAALDIAGIDMTDFGFPEMDDFTDAQTSIAEDDIPDAPVEAVAKRGDIWQLGDHVLMCGDSTPAEYIKAMSNPGDIVIEPFGGAGTTLMACEQLGRKCRIMELEPKYVDVIIKRWEDFTGRKAVLLNEPG